MRRTPQALNSIRHLPNAEVGRALKQWIADIAADPIGRTSGRTGAARVCDGMEIISGVGTYYCKVIFTHVPGSNVVTLLRVEAQETTGPH